MSEPKEIPAAILEAATEAIAATQYCSQWGAGKLAEVALITAGVPEMLAQIAELESDTERLRWLMDNSGIDGFYGVTNDRYDFAFDCADEADRDEPNKEDEFNGWRRLIDAAMKSAESVEVSE